MGEMKDMIPQTAILIEGLGHEEALIRNTCLSYLSELPRLDPIVTRRALESVDRYGREAFTYPHELASLPIDAPTASWVREHVFSYDPETEWTDVYHYLRWLINGPDLPELVEWLKASFAGRPRQETPRLRLSHLLRSARTRHAVGQMEMETAFNRIHACFDEIENADTYRQDLWEEAEGICQRMLALNGPAGLRPLVEEWLDFDGDSAFLPNDGQTYMGVYLAGHCGMGDYLPQILALYRVDEYGLNEYLQEALVRMGTPAVLRELRFAFNRLDWVGQLYTSTAFERQPYPEFSGFFKDHLANPDPDDPIQLSFVVALALCGTQEGRAAAHAFYDIAPDHPEMEIVGQILYTQYRLRGIHHPAIDVIRERLLATERRFRFSQQSQPFPLADDDTLIPFPDRSPSRASNSPGRNDPCPCGSGKKYKKCCLKKQT